MLPKIKKLRQILDERNLGAELEVDGGIKAENAPLAIQAGANVLVAGSAVFGYQKGIMEAIKLLRLVTG
jgi:ribulose-phosphate 3-epimerase